MEWLGATKDEDGKLTVPAKWLLSHYYEALTILFRVENALRLFVYVALKEKHGPKWLDLCIASEDEKNTTITALAKRRIEQGKAFGYLSYPIQSPLMHLTSGELVGLITHDAYWPTFMKYFLADRKVVTLKLQGTIRNALAHFRPVSPGDVEVVKLNATQMLSEVEQTLVELIQCSQTVPTNTEEDWYTQLRTLGTDRVTLGFSQSKDEAWIRISLRYESVLVSTGQLTSSMRRFRLTTVETPAVLETAPLLRDRVLFVTENVPFVRIPDEDSPTISKDICLTFSKRILAQDHAEIKASIEGILTQLVKETELLREDQLARGRLVHITSLTAKRTENESKARWLLTDRQPLYSAAPVAELPEYWGRITIWKDFISDTEEYPWMPVTVAEFYVPF